MKHEWWCSECDVYVLDKDVSIDFSHEECGTPVVWQDPDWKEKEL